MDTLLSASGAPYTVRPDELRPWSAPCPDCGGASTRVEFEPRTLVTGRYDYSLLGGLTRHMGPTPCPVCDLLRDVARLCPPPEGRSIVAPVEAELAALRASLRRTDPLPAPAPVFTGQAFSVGTIHATPAVLIDAYMCATGKADVRDVAGGHEWGRPHLDPVLSRFAAGDLGGPGRIGEGDVVAGSCQNPLARSIDRSAAAVAQGFGVVEANYLLGLTEMRTPNYGAGRPQPVQAGRREIIVRAGITPRGNFTLVCSPHELSG